MDNRPQVLILSGFLGSGKTTILMQIIARVREAQGPSYKIAIIENEIGSASVDSNIIEEAGYSVTEMLAGCVCCTLIGQLVPALEKLQQELEPELIILEATGVATPGSMKDSIETYGGCSVRVATLVDAARWERIAVPLRMLLEGQLEPADIVCLNKIDLVDSAALAAIENSVREINAHAPLVRVSAAAPMSAADLDAILGA